MPRSERCRIRGNCLHGIALLSLAQGPVAAGAPGAAQVSCRRPERFGAGGAPTAGAAPAAVERLALVERLPLLEKAV
jgi:hypothetical protein